MTISRSVIIASLFVPMFFLMGCTERFRYVCQDPDNWNKDFCQRPVCELNRECPDMIFAPGHGPIPKNAPPPTKYTKKGDCK